MRYPVSGANQTALQPATSTAATGGITSIYAVTSGRVFWLRGIQVPVATVIIAQLQVWDTTQASGATTPTTTKMRLALNLPTSTETHTEPAVHSFGAPGIKFESSPKARTTASVESAIGSVTVWGYEE